MLDKVGGRIQNSRNQNLVFRDLGITSYGYSPFAFAPREFSGVHGNDERLAVEQLRRGVKIYYTVLQQFTARR